MAPPRTESYYGSIGSSSSNDHPPTSKPGDEEMARLIMTPEEDAAAAPLSSTSNKRHCCSGRPLILLLSVFAILGATGGGLGWWAHVDARHRRHHQNGGGVVVPPQMKNKNHHNSSATTNPSSSSASQPQKSAAAAAGISLLSPVDDDMDWLRVVEQRRDETSMPSRLWWPMDGDSNALPSSDKKRRPPLPTNSWYLNLLSHRAAARPDESTRAYTIPYIIDAAVQARSGYLDAGIRVHWPVVSASTNNIQMLDDYKNSLALGTTAKNDESDDISTEYRVHDVDRLSPLGVSLEWSSSSGNNSTTTSSDNDSNNPKPNKKMVTHIVRGMPYATMQYQGGVLPSLYSFNGPASPIQVDDQGKELPCQVRSGSSGSSGTHTTTSATPVNRLLRLHLTNSDFTWAVWFSRPVVVQCTVSDAPLEVRDLQLNIVRYDDAEKEDEQQQQPLTVRVALLNQCTTGQSDIVQHCLEKASWKDSDAYEALLLQHAHVIPTNPQIDFDFWSMSSSTTTQQQQQGMTIDWGAAQTTADGADEETVAADSSSDNQKLLMFALPHHQEELRSSANNNNDDAEEQQQQQQHGITQQCINTFHGSTCLVLADTWKLTPPPSTTTTRPMSFTAPRPPDADAIPLLAKALAKDIHYRLSSNLLRAAADTYFSGKILARLARVILIASELQTLAAVADSVVKGENDDDVLSHPAIQELYGSANDGDNEPLDQERLWRSIEGAASVKLPSQREMTAAVEKLKKGVEIWLDHRAEAPYVYDHSWGGLVNCGCRYVGKGEHGKCGNKFPDCPALVDVNEDFGNGYYNDHHYHYGYHVYAAAVAARFDSEWGEKMFDRVLLYIRDFANPFPNDEYFTPFRQKDWFLGSSWASGIVSAENSPHGRNEESSSEAIAAYEAVTLFGSVMVDVFGSSSSPRPSNSKKDENNNNNDKLQAARLVRDAGQFLTTTELAATNRYWHVWSSDVHTNTYPAAYKQPVVGMLYDTMASFQTWFAPQAVVSYGIQLIPFTPVAEQRDDPEWAAELYPLYEQSCQQAGDFCIKNGWSILQAGLCATAGHAQDAMEQALAIPPQVFNSQGGVGNSLSNTIWYISTRKPRPETTAT